MLVQNACELNMQDHGVNVAGAVKGCSLILWIGVKIFQVIRRKESTRSRNSYMSVEGGVLVLIMCGGMSYFDLN
jgi:hypothetical protein